MESCLEFHGFEVLGLRVTCAFVEWIGKLTVRCLVRRGRGTVGGRAPEGGGSMEPTEALPDDLQWPELAVGGEGDAADALLIGLAESAAAEDGAGFEAREVGVDPLDLVIREPDRFC